MPREVKQVRALPDEAARTVDLASRPSRPAADPARRSIWFEALDPAAAPPVPRRSAVAAAPLLVAAIASFALLHGVLLRTAVPLALVAAAIVVLWRARLPRAAAQVEARGSRPPLEPRRSWRGLSLDGDRLVFRADLRDAPVDSARAARASLSQRAPLPGALPGASAQPLLLLDAPFGVTLLATPRRDRLVALVSSERGTFYLGAAFDAAARRAFAPLLDRASTVVNDDVGLEAIGPDGEALIFSPDELASLLDVLVERSPSCLDRFVLTDARGAALTLDGRVLCAGERAVDLTAPLEWRPIVFQEAFGQAVAVYQGTWIRQGGTELVLVSLLPSLGPVTAGSIFGSGEIDLASLDPAVLRHLRLMQASPEQPPPTEQRVAIERLFMLPVRSALDRAPRASHQPNRAQA